MPQFKYKALTQGKRIDKGVVTSKNRDEVARELSKKGLSPITITEVKKSVKIKGSVPVLEKIIFCRYLSTMLSSGLSLSEGVSVLHEEAKHPLMKRILGDMIYGLEQGQTLSSVFERYPQVFEPYFLTLTKAGELSGTLGEVFKYLEEELRAEYNLNSKIKNALLYPSIVFVSMIAIGVLMFFFVLPQIGRVFLNLRIPLPTLTRLLFTFSLTLSRHMLPILISAVVGVVGIILLLKNKAVKHLLFTALRPVPMVHNLMKKIDMARFNRIFSTLIKSAVPITEALEISLSSLTLREYQSLSKSMPEEVRKGKQLTKVVKDNKQFPTLVVQIIAAGEKSGTLDEALGEIARFYESEVEEELKNLTQIIEPVLMLLVGIGVGAMILSIIAPIYSVVSSFQQAAGGP